MTLALLVVPLWIAICNWRTGALRDRIIDSWRPGSPLFWPRVDEFDRVPYHQHLWHCITLRDPRKLYGAYTSITMGWWR